MELSIAAPHQHNQPSRKGKKAWRKNVDVSDIQAGLDNVRDEVIKGGIIAEKPSEALFTLDTTGSSEIRKSYKLNKTLKADAILGLRSAVPAVDSHKRPGVTDGVIDPSSKRRKKNGVSPRELERLKSIAYGGAAVSKDIVNVDGAEYDPWAVKDEEKDPRFSYLEKAKPIKAPQTLREPSISLVLGADALPAVTKPKGGLSYNPEFQEWEQVLTEEGAKEVEAEKKRLKEAALEQERLDRIAAARAERDHYQTEDESAWEGFESEYEGAEWLKKRRPERKTPAERNKVKRRKEAERQRKHEAPAKARAQQAQKIKDIAEKIEAESKAKVVAIVESKEADDRILRRRKLGKDTLPEPPLELVLPDELQESLRLLKPEVNLLKDRFRSILVRGKVETRNPISQPKKARRTYTEKWTYKDFKVPA